MRKEDKKELLKFLNSNNLMTLATVSPDPWAATVYYATDKDLNLYFVSSPNSKHSKDIEKNKKVAIAIYDSHTKNKDKKVGVQLTGIASQVKGWERTGIFLKMWHKAAPGAEEIVNVKNMMEKVISSRVYKITPNYIKFFNQKLYGDDESKGWKL